MLMFFIPSSCIQSGPITSAYGKRQGQVPSAIAMSVLNGLKHSNPFPRCSAMVQWSVKSSSLRPTQALNLPSILYSLSTLDSQASLRTPWVSLTWGDYSGQVVHQSHPVRFVRYPGTVPSSSSDHPVGDREKARLAPSSSGC